jgi:hypothetical protein
MTQVNEERVALDVNSIQPKELKCDFCHKKIQGIYASEMKHCLLCNQILCDNCIIYDFCPSDFNHFTPSMQQQIIQIDFQIDKKHHERKQMIVLNLVLICLTLMISFLLNIDLEYSGLIIMLILVGLCTILQSKEDYNANRRKLEVINSQQKSISLTSKKQPEPFTSKTL